MTAKNKHERNVKWKKMYKHYPFYRVNRDWSRTLPEEARSKQSNIRLMEYKGFYIYLHWHLNGGIKNEVYNSDEKFLAESWCEHEEADEFEAEAKKYIDWVIKHNHFKLNENGEYKEPSCSEKREKVPLQGNLSE